MRPLTVPSVPDVSPLPAVSKISSGPPRDAQSPPSRQRTSSTSAASANETPGMTTAHGVGGSQLRLRTSDGEAGAEHTQFILTVCVCLVCQPAFSSLGLSHAAAVTVTAAAAAAAAATVNYCYCWFALCPVLSSNHAVVSVLPSKHESTRFAVKFFLAFCLFHEQRPAQPSSAPPPSFPLSLSLSPPRRRPIPLLSSSFPPSLFTSSSSVAAQLLSLQLGWSPVASPFFPSRLPKPLHHQPRLPACGGFFFY